MAKALWLSVISAPVLIVLTVAWPGIMLPLLAGIFLMVVGVF